MEKKKRRNVVSNTPKADGLRMIGRHAYAAKQEMESKAETLYKGKVLIDRQRTRDLMPINLNNMKCGYQTLDPAAAKPVKRMLAQSEVRKHLALDSVA